jgi:hypothetical protein
LERATIQINGYHARSVGSHPGIPVTMTQVGQI